MRAVKPQVRFSTRAHGRSDGVQCATRCDYGNTRVRALSTTKMDMNIRARRSVELLKRSASVPSAKATFPSQVDVPVIKGEKGEAEEAKVIFSKTSFHSWTRACAGEYARRSLKSVTKRKALGHELASSRFRNGQRAKAVDKRVTDCS